MGETTTIQWTDATLSPWDGCTKVGPGCDNCYAEAIADKRFHIVKWGAGQPRKKRETFNANAMKLERKAIREGRQIKVFISMCDPFDNAVPDAWRAELFTTIRNTPHLTWLLLTKRIGNVDKMLGTALAMQPNVVANIAAWPWPNVWIGATVVNRDEMLRDGPKLKVTPAALHFWSVEPMLGDLGTIPPELMPQWVILGFESGKDARPGHPDWARKVRDDCAAAGVPFFFKQWGEWLPFFDGCENPNLPMTNHPGGKLQNGMWKVGTKASGNHLDGRQHLEFPAL